MSEFNLPLFSKSNTNDIGIFIEFWSKFYGYGNEELYSNNIRATKFNESNIKDLYRWKNGMPLSDLKMKSLEKNIISKLEQINRFKSGEAWSTDDFYSEFISVSTVWKIFLLHIINPRSYPIYDQHIHRAYQYMNKLPIDGVNTKIKESEKLEFYNQLYLPFVKNLNVHDMKKMDEAFFSFGQFLNTGLYKKLII